MIVQREGEFVYNGQVDGKNIQVDIIDIYIIFTHTHAQHASALCVKCRHNCCAVETSKTSYSSRPMEGRITLNARN